MGVGGSLEAAVAHNGQEPYGFKSWFQYFSPVSVTSSVK